MLAGARPTAPADGAAGGWVVILVAVGLLAGLAALTGAVIGVLMAEWRHIDHYDEEADHG